MVAFALKWTKKVAFDRGGAGIHCRGLPWKEFQRLSREGSTCCLWTSRLLGGKKRARVERGAEGVPMEPATGEQRQHDENTVRDIHIGNRGSGTAHEEQPGKFEKQYSQSKNFQIPLHSQPCMCLLNILRVVRDKTERNLHLCRIQVMWTMT